MGVTSIFGITLIQDSQKFFLCKSVSYIQFVEETS